MVDKLNTNAEIILEDVRLSYPRLWKAERFQNKPDQKAMFSAAFIIDPVKQKRLHNQILDAIEDVQIARDWDKDECRGDKICYANGNRKAKKRDEYKDMYVLAAKNERRPKVVDRMNVPLQEEDGVIYAGCRVDAIVRIYSLDNSFGRRVNCSLEVVRFRKDDEAFGAEPADPDDLPPLEDDGNARGKRGGVRSERGRDDRGSRDRDRDERDSYGREREPDNRGSRRERNGSRDPRDGERQDRDRGRDRDRNADREIDRERGSDRDRERDREVMERDRGRESREREERGTSERDRDGGRARSGDREGDRGRDRVRDEVSRSDRGGELAGDRDRGRDRDRSERDREADRPRDRDRERDRGERSAASYV